HSAVINWGDGTSSNGSVSESGGAGSVTGTHAYTVPGTYTVSLTVTDDDLGSVTRTTTLTVQGSGVTLQNGILYILGTNGDDQVTINGTGSGQIKVHASFLDHTLTFNTADIALIKVSLLGGSDHLVISDGVDIPVLVDGGTGLVHNGGGTSIVLGGFGQVSKGGRADSFGHRLVGNYLTTSGGALVVQTDSGYELLFQNWKSGGRRWRK